jgi:hypothetical protein
MKNRTKNLKRKGILSAMKIKEEPMRTKHCKSLQFTDLYITCCKLLGYVSVASAREYWNRGIEKSTACPLMFPCVTSGRNYSVLGQAVTDRRRTPLIKSWLQRGAVWRFGWWLQPTVQNKSGPCLPCLHLGALCAENLHTTNITYCCDFSLSFWLLSL